MKLSKIAEVPVRGIARVERDITVGVLRIDHHPLFSITFLGAPCHDVDGVQRLFHHANHRIGVSIKVRHSHWVGVGKAIADYLKPGNLFFCEGCGESGEAIFRTLKFLIGVAGHGYGSSDVDRGVASV